MQLRQRRGRSSFEVFVTSLHAFLLREMKNQYGRFRLGYFWAFVEPGATVAVLTLMHSGLNGPGASIYGEHPIVFFVFGAVPFFLFANCVARAQGIFESHKGLFNYRQIKPIDVILARCIIDSVMMLGVLLSFVAGWLWAGHELHIDDPLRLLAALGSLFVLGLSLGMTFEVLGTVFGDLKRIFNIAMRPLFIISGLFFTIDSIPEAHRALFTWNPILHCIDVARDAVLPGYESPGSLAYAWICIATLLFTALASYRRYLYQLL